MMTNQNYYEKKTYVINSIVNIREGNQSCYG